MTKALEKEFFKKYGIEPKIEDACKIADEYWNNEKLADEYFTFDKFMKKNCPTINEDCTSNCEHAYDLEIYPTITDKHYLQFICLLNKSLTNFLNSIYDLKELKEEILLNMINKNYLYKQEIQEIFKEDQWN